MTALVFSRVQPDGARLDDDGRRLWQWFGTGSLEEFYSVTTMLREGVVKQLLPWGVRITAELAYADVLAHGPHSRASAITRRWAMAGRRYLDAQRAAGMKLDKADESPKGLALRWLKGAHERERDAAAEIGSDVHDAAEAFVLEHAREGARLYAATGELPSWPDEIAPRMGAFVAFLADKRPIYVATEARVFSRSRTYAGRADAFLRVRVPEDWQPPAWIARPFVWEREGGEPGWLTLCVDYKAGREVYHEVALQTCAYARGDFIGAPDDVTELPVPAVDGTAVLHLTARGPRFRLLRFDDYVFRKFLYAREMAEWIRTETRVGTRTWLGEDVPADLADALAASLDAAGVA